jgi:hypothetical protein
MREARDPLPPPFLETQNTLLFTDPGSPSGKMLWMALLISHIVLIYHDGFDLEG